MFYLITFHGKTLKLKFYEYYLTNDNVDSIMNDNSTIKLFLYFFIINSQLGYITTNLNHDTITNSIRRCFADL